MELARLREAMHKLAPGSVSLASSLESSLEESALEESSLAGAALEGLGGPGTGAGALSHALAITPVRSGISALDEALLLGGLPAGRVSEIAGPSSSGKTALGLSLLAEQTRAGKLVAYVDGTGQFYPPAAAAMGLDLPRTLLIAPSCKRARSRDKDEVSALARAAEIIARSRAFSMVLIDLPRHARVSEMPARRLRAASQATGTTIIALCTRAGDVEGAAARIETSPCQELCSQLRRTQFRIAKGGRSMGAHVEVNCKRHRFDSLPPQTVAPIQYRALPGQEPAAHISFRTSSSRTSY